MFADRLPSEDGQISRYWNIDISDPIFRNPITKCFLKKKKKSWICIFRLNLVYLWRWKSEMWLPFLSPSGSYTHRSHEAEWKFCIGLMELFHSTSVSLYGDFFKAKAFKCICSTATFTGLHWKSQRIHFWQMSGIVHLYCLEVESHNVCRCRQIWTLVCGMGWNKRICSFWDQCPVLLITLYTTVI